MGVYVRNASGIGDYLKHSPELAASLAKAAQKVATETRRTSGRPVETHARVTDRAVVDVVLAHPAGGAEQAKNGTLTRAAMAAGLEVRSR